MGKSIQQADMAEAHHKVAGPDQKVIGAWLQRARKKAGFSQQDAAVYLDVDKQTVSDWETGRYRMSAEACFALILRYKADVLELLATKLVKGAVSGAQSAPERKRRTG